MLDAVQIMQKIIEGYANNPKWLNVPLGGIKTLSNTHVGKVGEDFIKMWCQKHHLKWSSPSSTQSPWDIRIESITFEIKSATEDVNGNFQFNHIRRHREYDALLVLGISPNDIRFDAWGKDTVVQDKAGRLATMDKESNATFKMTKKPSDLRPIDHFVDGIYELVIDLRKSEDTLLTEN
ncbi:MAG: hypothetical protein OXH00_17885 [Candidatus Poribacteria bacterium]|nr:hypothetical protein [Candidatus Poribacteria bacterium]